MIEKEDNYFLEANIKGLMMTLLGQWNKEMDQGRDNTEFAEIRPSDMRVFGQIRGKPTRLADLHRALGCSRQAAQQAVDRLVAHGVLRVHLANGSKRDKVVSVTGKGQRLRALAARQIREIEEKCMAAIGAVGTERLRQYLAELVKDTDHLSP